MEEIINKKTPINEFVIKEIHQLVLKNIWDRDAGSYRSINVFLQASSHLPPMSSLVLGLMRDLIEWLDGDAKSLHPIEKTAIFHHRFVHIHPFVDGNGRTASTSYESESDARGIPSSGNSPRRSGEIL